MSDKEEKLHVDEYVWGSKMFELPAFARVFFLKQRQPAYLKGNLTECGFNPKLFADYKGKRVRVTMASRLGHIGITENLEQEHGYEAGAWVEELSNFSDKE